MYVLFRCERCRFAKFPTEYALIEHCKKDHGLKEFHVRFFLTRFDWSLFSVGPWVDLEVVTKCLSFRFATSGMRTWSVVARTWNNEWGTRWSRSCPRNSPRRRPSRMTWSTRWSPRCAWLLLLRLPCLLPAAHSRLPLRCCQLRLVRFSYVLFPMFPCLIDFFNW